MAIAVGYERAKNVKHREMKDDVMNFASATAAQDATFANMTTTHGNLCTKLRQK